MKKYSKKELSIIVRSNIKKLRTRKNLTLQELADKAGLSHGYVKDLESFALNKTPSLEAIGKFANALEVDIKVLFNDI